MRFVSVFFQSRQPFKSYGYFSVISIYEIKINQYNMLQDIAKEKHLSYGLCLKSTKVHLFLGFPLDHFKEKPFV